MPVSVCAVLVLYDNDIQLSETYNSLYSQIEDQNIPLLVWDNGPNPNSSPEFSDFYIYDESNSGLVSAYNAALHDFSTYDWILLLDQDSVFPCDYIRRALYSLGGLDPTTVAFIPEVLDGGVLYSPVRHLSIASYLHSNGLYIKTFINSGAFISVKFINSIGGYPKFLKLDFVDTWLSYRIHFNRQNVSFFTSTVEHHLSISSVKNISTTRLSSIFESEFLFYKNESWAAFLLDYKLRLIFRLFKTLVKFSQYDSRYLKFLYIYILKWRSNGL